MSISFQTVASADLATGSNVEECFLCESPVEVRFEPCGHAILCSACAERAKKCIKCRVWMKCLISLYTYFTLKGLPNGIIVYICTGPSQKYFPIESYMSNVQ